METWRRDNETSSHIRFFSAASFISFFISSLRFKSVLGERGGGRGRDRDRDRDRDLHTKGVISDRRPDGRSDC